LSDGIRRAAPSGTTRLGEETDGGIPRVSSAGKARLAGVGRGVAVSRLDDLLGVRVMGVGTGPDTLDAEGGVERLRGFAACLEIELEVGRGGMGGGGARGRAREEREER